MTRPNDIEQRCEPWDTGRPTKDGPAASASTPTVNPGLTPNLRGGAMPESIPAQSDNREQARLYRCIECGKWSHAQRKPARHKRWITDDGAVSDPDPAVVVYSDPGHYGQYEDVPGGWMIWCGPLREWVAVPAQDGR